MQLYRPANLPILDFNGFKFLPWVYKLNKEFVEDINSSLEYTKGGCVRYIGREVKHWLNTTDYIRFPRPNGSRKSFQYFYNELHFYLYGRGLSYPVEMRCQDPKCINPEHFRYLEDSGSWVYNYIDKVEKGFKRVDIWHEYVAIRQEDKRWIVLKSKTGLCNLLKISPPQFDRYCRTGRIWKGKYKFMVLENEMDLTGDFDYGSKDFIRGWK